MMMINRLLLLIMMILLLMMSVTSQVSKPIIKTEQLPKNKYNMRDAQEIQDTLFTDATKFQPQSPCKHNIDIVWTSEVGSSIYQTPMIAYLNGKSTQKDVIIPTFVRYVEVLHGPTGNEKHSNDDQYENSNGQSLWPFSHSKFISHSSPLLYDIDGDDEQEVVVSTANGEVSFLKSNGQLLREKTIKLLPIKLDKFWFEGLNDQTMDISMSLLQKKNRNQKQQQQQQNQQQKQQQKQQQNQKRKLLQVVDDAASLPFEITSSSLSSEAKESMKLIYIPQSMRAFIDELDKQDNPFLPSQYESELNELKSSTSNTKKSSSSVYVDAHLLNTPVIIDLDQDGRDELIFAATYFYDSEYYESNPFHMKQLDTDVDIHNYVAGALVVYDLTTRKKKWELHLDLTTDHTASRAHIYSNPTVVDVDSDGSLEIVISTSLGWIYVVDKHGNTREGFPVLLGEIQGQVVVEDVNNDGDMEICAADASSNVVCFDYRGKPIWEKVISGRASTTMAVSDLNGDKILDLVIATSSGHIWALRGDNGEVLPGYPLKTGGPILSTPSIITLNDDNKQKNKQNNNKLIIVPSHDGFLYIIESQTLCIDKIDIGERIYSQVLIDDLTGNGYMNLLVTTMNGNVFNLGTDWPYHPLKAITQQVNGNGFTERFNYHGIMVSERSRQHRDEIGSTFRIEFEIIDERIMPKHIPRRYVVKVTIGGTQTKLFEKLYDSAGRYQIVLETPKRRFYGKVIVTMTNEHGAIYEDSFTLGFNISFLNMFKWMVVLPFVACAGVLLYLFGTDKHYGIEQQQQQISPLLQQPQQQQQKQQQQQISPLLQQQQQQIQPVASTRLILSENLSTLPTL